MYLGGLTWKKAEELRAKKGIVAILPLGSLEEHGPIGPLATDAIIHAFAVRLR